MCDVCCGSHSHLSILYTIYINWNHYNYAANGSMWFHQGMSHLSVPVTVPARHLCTLWGLFTMLIVGAEHNAHCGGLSKTTLVTVKSCPMCNYMLSCCWLRAGHTKRNVLCSALVVYPDPCTSQHGMDYITNNCVQVYQ